MLKRYIGDVSPATIYVGGQDFGTVETGDSIAIPDDLAESVAWAEENWEDVASQKETKDNTQESD
jgi:hypothetical protein